MVPFSGVGLCLSEARRGLAEWSVSFRLHPPSYWHLLLGFTLLGYFCPVSMAFSEGHKGSI